MIEVKGLTKVYQMGDNKVWALKGVDLLIEEGDFVAIMGPSGSGKSTLTQILGLLDSPTSGSYKLNGREVGHLTEEDLAILRREEIGFIFQQFNLLPRMDAAENVSLPLFYSKKPGGRDAGQKLLERVGLGPRSHHKPKEMSGGQQQRVAIARSLVNAPRIIMADEPTGNLDSVSEEEIMKILQELNAQGITILMVTHEDSIAEKAKRIIRIRDGEVLSDERRVPHKAPGVSIARIPPPPPPIGWRDIKEHFIQGKRTLAANKIRTALSMLGILIGVASVVAMLAIGRGAQESIEAQLSSLGSNMLVLRTGNIRRGGVAQAESASRMEYQDAKMLMENLPAIKEAVPTVNGQVTVSFLNKNRSTQVIGTTPGYQELRNARPTLGRFFTETEDQGRARVTVIGTTVVKDLFGDKNPIGESLKVNKVNFLIIGVLPSKSGGWRDENDVVIVPLQTGMKRLLGKTSVDSINIQVRSAEALTRTEDDVLEMMFKEKKVPFSQREDTFEIQNMADIQEALSSTSKTMSVLLASIATISLLVGGIGIMNIMLVSITERTKEIGLRKAVGARPIDILWQFLAESVVVSVVGGTIGIVIGVSVSVLLASVAGWPTSVTWDAIALAFGFSVLVGIVFGVYPARKASLLSPLEALRYE